MPPAKAQKVDISSTYPCPCRRQGQLVPITLTEAFGCQRCQQIFVLKQDGCTIEQLSTTYPYKRTWYWNGHQWHTARQTWGEGYWYFTLGLSFFVLLPLLLWLPLMLNVPLSPEVILWVIATLLLAVVPAVVAWLALYRRY
uniref:Uncharacterized protein n=1 Tax=Cyanothece sp. (strain PCC 7425 / ATCC 29141) TaxID=395961 RepID=B8HLF6_CYAP4